MQNNFDEETIRKYLPAGYGENLFAFDIIDSTNRFALDLAANGAPNGTVVTAAAQTAGRGRLGRSFYSPNGTGIYVSEIFRLSSSADEVLYLTVEAAVAVCRAIEELTSERAAVKWVNDIYMRDRKVCGILVQGVFENGKMTHAVVGVGVNITPPDGGFPSDISNVAGGIFDNSDDGVDMRPIVTAKVIRHLTDACKLPVSGELVSEYRRRSWLDGAQVNVVKSLGTFPARVVGVDEHCRLEVVYADGNSERLSAGEVSVKRTAL